MSPQNHVAYKLVTKLLINNNILIRRLGDRFYGTSDEFEEEQSKIKKSGEMISKSKIEKSVNQLVQPIQYWLL